MPFDDTTVALALNVIDRAWGEIRKTAYVALATGSLPDRLPDFSPEEAARCTRLGEALLRDIARIDTAALPADLALTFEITRGRAEQWARAERSYWLIVDVGFPCCFLPSAYGAGYFLNGLRAVFAAHPLGTAADRHRYLALVHDYARMVAQMDARTRGQAERGIRIPRAQLALSVPLMHELRAAAIQGLAVASERADAAFAAEVQTAIETAVLPAFDGFIAGIEDPDYAALAPDAVGLGQYPGGQEVYAELVREHTTLELTPEQVHARGHERMGEVQAAMRALLDRVGFAGDPHDYLEQLKTDPAWHAQTPEAIGAFYQRYIDRIAPHIDQVFRFKPRAGHGVKPLAAELAGSMTFGYYAPPSVAQAEGLYMFNAVNLAQTPLHMIAALNYHELVPGHHLHIASQNENETLHPLRKFTLFGAFNEGWAEYAASLAGELGMYAAPEEQLGRLVSDAFLTCRLVVDTGMNAFGWSLERARDYMRAYSFMSEREIGSETLRYSCGLPGQALAYKLGDDFLMAQRERMRQALGNRFDLRDFHDAVLKPGGLPLPLVARNIDAALA